MKSFIAKKFNSLSNDRLFGDIFKGSLLVFVTKVGATAIGLVTSVIVARWYGAEVVGIVALISSYLSIIALPAILGTDTSVLRLIPEQIAKYSYLSAFNLYKKARYLVILLSLVIGIILAFFSGFISEKVFKEPDLTYFFMAASLLLVFRSLQQFSNQGLRAVNKINAFAYIQVLMPVMNLVLLVILTYFFYDFYNPVYIQLFLFVFIAVIGLIIINKAFKEKIEEQDITENVTYKTILGISLPMFLTSSMLVIIGQLATIMVGMFRSAEDVGYYAIALRISTLTTFVLLAINTVVAPKFSALFNEGKIDDLFYVARKSTKLIFWSVLPLILIFVFFGKWIIVLLYGS
ncbi:MAG TPA: oligosaccharide flippase family protein, partial [Bacteroidales bacterium]